MAAKEQTVQPSHVPATQQSRGKKRSATFVESGIPAKILNWQTHSKWSPRPTSEPKGEQNVMRKATQNAEGDEENTFRYVEPESSSDTSDCDSDDDEDCAGPSDDEVEELASKMLGFLKVRLG